MDFHSQFLECFVNADYLEASKVIQSIPSELRFAYQFLLDETNERYDCIELNDSMSLAVRAATLRCIYRKRADYQFVLEKATELRKSVKFSEAQQSDRFWVLFNELTMGFAFHSLGNLRKAEEIYILVAKEDQETVKSILLELEARITLIELYLEEGDEKKYRENKKRVIELLEQYRNSYLHAIFLIAESE